MFYAFDGEAAEKYGVDEAILLYHIAYWVYINEAMEKNFLNGRYWTYNSGKAFERLFPYWKDRQIRNKLQHMVDEGLILKGTFGDNRYDHTCWYTLSDKGKSICQNWTFDWTKFTNQSDKNDQSYNTTTNNIDSDTYYNTDNKPYKDIEKQTKSFVKPTVEEVRAYCVERNNNVDAEQFIDFYEANGWVQGRQGKPIKDWKACVRTWERSGKKGMSEIDRRQRASYDDSTAHFFESMS